MWAAPASSAAWPDGDAGQHQDRQRQQHADQHRDRHQLPVIGVGDRAGQANFGCARGVEHAPVRTDAAFEGLPRLIEGFDDVVVDAERVGAGDELAQHRGLRLLARERVAPVVAGARPAELGDDDALAGIGLPQQVVDADGLVDGGGFRDAFPVRQHVRGDEVDRGGKLRMIDPGVPDFAGGDGDRGVALDALDLADQLIDRLLAAVDRLVADHDAVDVAMLAGEVDDGAQLALVALGVLVDPGADRDPQAELLGDRGHELGAAGRRIGADHAGVGRDGAKVGADLRRGRALAAVGMRRAVERRVGQACELIGNVGGDRDLARKRPQSAVHTRDNRRDQCDEAHQSNHMGLENLDTHPSPGWAVAASAACLNVGHRMLIPRSWRIDDGDDF